MDLLRGILFNPCHSVMAGGDKCSQVDGLSDKSNKQRAQTE